LALVLRKLGLIGPSTSLRVEESSSFGLGLGLIGFDWVCFLGAERSEILV